MGPGEEAEEWVLASSWPAMHCRHLVKADQGSFGCPMMSSRMPHTLSRNIQVYCVVVVAVLHAGQRVDWP